MSEFKWIGSYWRTDFLSGQSDTQETLDPMDTDNHSKENFIPKGQKKKKMGLFGQFK